MPWLPDFRRLFAGSTPAGRSAMPQHTKKFGLRDDPANAKGPSQRMLRVGELVRHKMAEMLARGEIHDDLLAGHVITIPEVRMAPDLKLATIYVMPLGGKDTAKILAALERNKRYIRGEISHTLSLKFAPDVRFREDESFAEARRIDQLLDSPKVKQDLDK
jgi:ribosome-binding factor A